MVKSIRSLAVVAMVVLSIAPNWAQEATVAQKGQFAGKGDYATLNIDCKLGSFKSIDGEGRLEVNFEGTMLVTKVEGGKLTVSPNLRKEYDEGGRVCYTGKGKVTVEGKWRGVQWLGSNMTGYWYGKGIMRVTGEFWKNPATGELETGKYWYDDKNDWQPFPSAGVMNVTVPEMNYGADTKVTPRVRTGGGN